MRADHASCLPMKRQLDITRAPINETTLLSQRQMSRGMGAAVYFLGVVRDTESDASIRALEYEAFVPMAERQFHLLLDEMEKRWPIESVRIIHRTGEVKVNEPSLWV